MTNKDDNPPLHLIRTPEGLAPATALDRELLDRWGVGTRVSARLTKPRSRREQNFFEAVVRVCLNHQDFYKTHASLRIAIKTRLGYVDHISLKNGETILVPISIRKMDHAEFHEFVNKVMDIVYEEIIPGLDSRGKKMLAAEIDRLAGVDTMSIRIT